MKDPLASRALADSDVVRALEAADRFVVTWREGRRKDAIWMGRYVRYALHFGPHVSVASGGWRRRTVDGKAEWRYSYPLTSSDLRLEGGVLYLVWRRPKTETPILAPVSGAMRPWLAQFLDAPRPLRRSRYNELLRELEDTVVGPRLILTPSRFRHTAATRLRRAEVPSEAICALLGTTERTLSHYVDFSPGQVASMLAERGLLE